MCEEFEVLQVAFEILSFMQSNPDAADTEEHIKSWWLCTRDIECTLGTVKNALNMLEQRRFIEHVELPDKRMAYRLNKHQ